MIYKKLSQRQKTLASSFADAPWAIALTVVGAYSGLPLPSVATPVLDQSALSSVSTATSAAPTPPSSLRLQFAQTQGQPTGRGAPGKGARQGGASRAQNPPKDRGAPGNDGRQGGASRSQNPPKDRGAPAPGQRTGGASRGMCPSTNKRLTALVPIISATPDRSQNPILTATPAGSVLGLTVASHPTFWVYSPYSLTSEHSVEFILQDDQGNVIYQTSLSASVSTPGVVGFKLPDSVPPLQVNKRYNWFFSIACDRKPEETPNELDEPTKIVVSAWVERIALEPSLQRELEQATPAQKALIYHKAGIWHEALTTLAELRRQQPNEATLKEEWEQLLRSINLEAIAPEPITAKLLP
ncbi:DUF928 domain-containing protein [Allocoleopsis sp.]|uniref:DUF928 domain-containing protein n=1 Tax=Allocoleopsis sp. TaxID=3088169 RepID=UPI002FD1DC3F